MNRIFTFLMITALSATIFSCGEDDKEEIEPVDPVEESTQLLTNGSSKDWLWTAQYSDGVLVDDACLYDNVFSYANGGTVNVTVNQPCYEGDVDYTRNWKFNDNATILQWIDGSDTYDFEVVELTSTKLVVTLEGDSQNSKFEYTAQ